MKIIEVDNSLIEDAVNKNPLTPLSVKSLLEDGFAIIDLAGALTLSPALSRLSDTARSVLATPKLSGLIIRVSEVSYTDSAGLGELTKVYSFASKRSCPLRMVGVLPNLRKILEMTHLDALLQPVETVEIAKKTDETVIYVHASHHQQRRGLPRIQPTRRQTH